MNIHIVTDSSAHGQLPSSVTVVPNTITVQGKSYREGVDLSPEDALRLFSHQPYAPLIHVPTQAEYLEVYDRLAQRVRRHHLDSRLARDSRQAGRTPAPPRSRSWGAARSP